MKVFVTGATGFIGDALVRALVERGDRVVALSRSAERARSTLPAGALAVEGDPQYEGDWQQSAAGCDAVVHLAGEPVGARRWNARVKQLIEHSRVEGTARVVDAITAEGARTRVLASASGIDYYPWAEDLYLHTARFEDDPVTESSPPGSSFLARVCRRWEAEAERAREGGVRVATMRTGFVIGNGGALDRLKLPFKFFVGGRIGSGEQWTSWISLRDVVRAYLFVLDHHEASGPFNLSAPENARNAELCREIGRTMGRPSWLPVPAFALRAAIGELADYVLHGRRAVPAALESTGFVFEHRDLRSALGVLR